MKKPTIRRESGDETSCFNGVGGSGRDSEFTSLIAPAMARIVKETNLIEFMRPQIEKLTAGDEVSCFNGVGGSGKEPAMMGLLQAKK